MTKEIFVAMALKAWNQQIKNTDRFFSALSDNELGREVAPGRNTLAYLLGHLIAVNEGMISLFGLGERKYTYFDEPFVRNPDRSGLPLPDVATLRTAWKQSNAELTAYFEKMRPEDWFTRHNAMTDEDLVKDPGRNKLSVLLNRTNHVAYHLGQLNEIVKNSSLENCGYTMEITCARILLIKRLRLRMFDNLVSQLIFHWH